MFKKILVANRGVHGAANRAGTRSVRAMSRGSDYV
jgi:hypothetical protein